MCIRAEAVSRAFATGFEGGRKRLHRPMQIGAWAVASICGDKQEIVYTDCQEICFAAYGWIFSWEKICYFKYLRYICRIENY